MLIKKKNFIHIQIQSSFTKLVKSLLPSCDSVIKYIFLDIFRSVNRHNFQLRCWKFHSTLNDMSSEFLQSSDISAIKIRLDSLSNLSKTATQKKKGKGTSREALQRNSSSNYSAQSYTGSIYLTLKNDLGLPSLIWLSQPRIQFVY